MRPNNQNESNQSLNQETCPNMPHDTQTSNTIIPKVEISHISQSQTSINQTQPTDTSINPSKPITPPPRRYATIPRKPIRNSKKLEDSFEPLPTATPIEERIQSRPLPAPPAPPRTLKKQSSGSVEPEDGRLSRTSTRSGRSAARDDLTYADTENFKSVAETLASSRTMAVTEQFHTVQDTLESHTLLVTGNKTRNSEDDLTLADSVVDSLQSCCETLIVDNDHENLDTCADTMTAAELDDQFYDDDDNPYPSVDFNSMMLGPGGHIVEPESPSVVRDSGASRRLEEGAEELSKELLEHVENLRTTLDNMSTRLGGPSKSDGL